MNERTVRIVQELSHSAGPCHLHDLATKFGVSDRTIRNDIKALNEFMAKKSLEPVCFGARGLVVLPAGFSSVERLLPVVDTFAYKMSIEERKELGAAILIGATDYVTLGEIAELFSVSRATILNDLDGIKALVASAGLEVESKPSHGIRVLGSERARRTFLVEFLGRGDAPIVDQWLSQPANAQLRSIAITVRKILNERCHASGIYMPDGPFQRAVDHLCVCVLRNRQGCHLDPSEVVEPESPCEPSEFERSVVALVGQYCSVRMGPGEEEFFAHTTQSMRLSGAGQFDPDDLQVKKLTRVFIRSVSQQYGVDLNDDYDLFEYLSNHLESMFTTEPSHFPESPALDEVINDQPAAFEAVQDNLEPLEEYAGRDITPVETKYIALHVCAALERRKNRGVCPRVVVVCDGGVGTSQLLAEELRGHFDIKIVSVMPAHDVPYIEVHNADLVISTVPLDNCPVESIVIHLPLRDREYALIHKKLDAIGPVPSAAGCEVDEMNAKGLLSRLEPLIVASCGEGSPLLGEVRAEVRRYFHEAQHLEGQILSPYLHQLLTPSHIRLDVECDDWREAVAKSAAPLLEMGYIEERYVDAMVAGIERYGAYDVLAPGFAVPHASPEEGTVKMGMSLIRLTHPVPFGDEDRKPVEFVCTLSAVDRKLHLKAFANLLDIITMPGNAFLCALREARTECEAAALVEKYEYQLLR